VIESLTTALAKIVVLGIFRPTLGANEHSLGKTTESDGLAWNRKAENDAKGQWLALVYYVFFNITSN
jgi:hypothetical protein